MSKKYRKYVLLMLLLVISIVILCACNGTGEGICGRYTQCFDPTHQMYITLPIYADWYNRHSPTNFYTTIKSVLSLKSIYKKLTKKTDYNITDCGDYLLIDTQQDGVEYSFGIFKYDKEAYDESRAYDYVITPFVCLVDIGDPSGREEIFFPFWAIGQSTIFLNLVDEYECSLSIDELYDYYVKHGYDITKEGNSLEIEYNRYRYVYIFENANDKNRKPNVDKSDPKTVRFKIVYETEKTLKFEVEKVS